MSDGLRRHDLVRIAPETWARHLHANSELQDVPHLKTWAEAGRPLIVRRSNPGESCAAVPLGLPLPPADGKRRIGLALSAELLEPYSAPTLADVIDRAPPAWRATMRALRDLGTGLGVVPRPFGALLWQAVTGLTYLSPTSDLDLLWPLTGALPPRLLTGIADIAAASPIRLDGEVILPDGAGIHWRELLEMPDDGAVLAKHRDRLELRSAAAVRDGIAA